MGRAFAAVFSVILLVLPASAWAKGGYQAPPQAPNTSGVPDFDPFYQSINEADEAIAKYQWRKENWPLINSMICFFSKCEKKIQETRAVRDQMEGLLTSGKPADQLMPQLQQLDPELDRKVSDLREKTFPLTHGKMLRPRDPKGAELYDRRLREAVESEPDNPEAWGMNAQNQLAQKDFEGAAASASKAIALGGGAESYAMRAAANTQLGDFSSAAADAKEALKLDPDSELAFQTLMLSEGRGSGSGGSARGGAGLGGGSAMQGAPAPTASGFKPATGVLKPMPARAGQSAELARRAQSAMAMKDYKSAMSLLTQAIESDPGNSQAYYLRANALSRLGLHRQSLADAEAGLAVSPDNVPLLNAKAFAQNRLKDYRGAYATAQAALALNPGNADAYANLAHALGGMGDRQGMLDQLGRAAALDPRYGAVLADLEVQAPTEGDALFLFPGEEGFSSAPKAVAGGKARRSYAVIAVAAVGGGFLIALGLLRALGPGPWQTVRSKLSRLTGSGPAVSELSMEPAEPGPVLTPPSDKDGPKPLGGQYEIVREIGEGGMGLVYEARDRGLQRRVAVKKMRAEIRDDAKERRRFLAEAKIVAALKHPSIVEIYSIVEEDGEVYLVFEFVQGKTLFEAVQASPLSFPAAVKLFTEVASALDYAHSRKVIHRDMKPSNVMIDEEGRARVMDFGVARVAKEALTRAAMTQTVFGTPPYMSPEQEQGMVSPQGDLYGMAICLYEALSGRLPFVGTGAGLLMNKMSMSFKPISELVPSLPQGVDAVFHQAFACDLAKRHKTAGAMLADLGRLLPKA